MKRWLLDPRSAKAEARSDLPDPDGTEIAEREDHERAPTPQEGQHKASHPVDHGDTLASDSVDSGLKRPWPNTPTPEWAVPGDKPSAIAITNHVSEGVGPPFREVPRAKRLQSAKSDASGAEHRLAEDLAAIGAHQRKRCDGEDEEGQEYSPHRTQGQRSTRNPVPRHSCLQGRLFPDRAGEPTTDHSERGGDEETTPGPHQRPPR